MYFTARCTNVDIAGRSSARGRLTLRLEEAVTAIFKLYTRKYITNDK